MRLETIYSVVLYNSYEYDKETIFRSFTSKQNAETFIFNLKEVDRITSKDSNSFIEEYFKLFPYVEYPEYPEKIHSLELIISGKVDSSELCKEESAKELSLLKEEYLSNLSSYKEKNIVIYDASILAYNNWKRDYVIFPSSLRVAKEVMDLNQDLYLATNFSDFKIVEHILEVS